MTTLRFSGIWPWWLVLAVSLLGSFLIARWYWRESRYLNTPMRWMLPVFRGAAFFFIVFMIAGPTLHHQRIQGELSRIRILIDNSQSMATVDAATSRLSRLERVLGWLIGESPEGNNVGLLEETKRHHRVELALSNQDAIGDLLWDSSVASSLPAPDSIQTRGFNSPLGEMLARIHEPKVASKSSNAANGYSAVILISDGQCNAGPTMQDSISRYVEEKVPVFAIGVGSILEPEDLGIVQVEHSQQVYRSDRLRGSILVKERIKPGTVYRIAIQHLGKQIFSKEMTSTNQGMRWVEFDVPAEALVDRAKKVVNNGAIVSALPIDLRFSIESNPIESSQSNNTLASSLWGVERKNRVLVLDRQGGWEMRYIKNAFERDTTWDASVLIGRAAFANEVLPKTRAELFDFDLIVANYDTLSRLDAVQQSWISEFVSTAGGGLIVCDGKRAQNGTAMDPALAALMPVRFQNIVSVREEAFTRVSSSAKDQPVLRLGTGDSENETVWSTLPTPKSMRSVSLVPGAESMIEIVGGKSNNEAIPLVTTKLFGQGRVVYLASDETWRWRYDVADLYHQRFWNQVANWTMRTPFAISNSYASLDAGARVYTPKDSILIRARLKKDDLRPLLDASAQAILYRDDQRYLSFPLGQESDARGFYRASLEPLPQGSYRVGLEVAGIPASALDIETQFTVQLSADIESQTLACNAAALRQIASTTGGEWFMLEDAESISEKLKRFRTGSIVETQTLLWQSPTWFFIIICLLSAEWYLRKRVGLV